MTVLEDQAAILLLEAMAEISRLNAQIKGIEMSGDHSEVGTSPSSFKVIKELRQQLAESQAECKRLDEGWHEANVSLLCANLDKDEAIKAAKREAYFEIAELWHAPYTGVTFSEQLHALGKELK